MASFGTIHQKHRGINTKIMEKLIVDAQSKCNDKLDLIAFPELFITGYNLRDNYNKIAEKIPSSGKTQKNIAENNKEIRKKLIGMGGLPLR